MTKNESAIMGYFPELEPGLSGLEKAYSICRPNLQLPDDTYPKIIHSFEYLIGNKSECFIKLYETDFELEKSKFSNRGFYNKKEADFSSLNFEDFLFLVIEALIFSQELNSAIRKRIERYYKEKGKKISRIQDLKTEKIAELGSYIIYDNKPRKNTSGENLDDYARISRRHGFELLKAIFDEALDLRLNIFNDFKNFDSALSQYLLFSPPNSLFAQYEVTRTEGSGVLSLKATPQEMSQKPS